LVRPDPIEHEANRVDHEARFAALDVVAAAGGLDMHPVARALKPLVMQCSPYLVTAGRTVNKPGRRVDAHAGQHGERDVGQCGEALDDSRGLDAHRLANLRRLRAGRQRAQNRIKGGAKGGWIATVELSVPSHLLLVDRKSTRLNSSHGSISYAVLFL